MTQIPTPTEINLIPLLTTAIVIALGWLIGGTTGAVVAFVIIGIVILASTLHTLYETGNL